MRILKTALVAIAAALVVVGCSGKGAARNAQVRVTAYDSLVRLSPQGKPLPLAEGTAGANTRSGGRSVAMSSARGESESAQIVIAADQGTRVRIDPPKLVNSQGADSIPAAGIDLYEVRTVSVLSTSPGGFGRRPGHVARDVLDPLVPLTEGKRVELPADRKLVVWMDVDVPTNARPGRYRGELRVRIGTNTKAKLPVELRVYDALLAPEPTLPTSIGIDLAQIEQAESVKLGTKRGQELLDRYINLLAAHRLTAADLDLDPAIGNDPNAFAQTPGADRIDLLAARTIGSTVRYPMYATFPFEDPLGTDRAAATRWLRNVAQQYRDRGFIDRAYMYIIDEPSRSDAQVVRAWVDLTREADPAIRFLLTANPDPVFGSGIDIWAVNLTGGYRTEPLRRAAKGAELWSYPSVSTHYPLPTVFSDDPRPSMRALGWMSYAEGLDGLLYWSINHWQEVDDPWAQGGTFRDNVAGAIANGDGVLVYPGRPIGVDGPAPSIRLKLLRDGIEDHMLLSLLAATRVGGAQAAREQALRLAPSPTQFELRPPIVNVVRKGLLEQASIR